ncbi:MAG: ABC-2 transporter permease [Oscillospiraceae bacterium]|jgi:ABC-type transport system involved in multi-copper enzyme maturation permease subunit|nr:ABC-2 transporter permease [Oscillospiraceae bacterium]
MTYNLLYKELRLAAHPNLFVFALLGVLVIVPAYPYGMVFIFGCLAPYITFTYGRETNDIYYTALLPVKKRDIVKGKFMLVALAQAASLLVSLPFAFLRVMLLPGGNPAGIEANVAFYGFGLMVYALFNMIFMTAFFKTAYKAGRAFLLAMMPITLLVIAMEVLAHIPALAWMDSVAAGDLLLQLPILLVGLVAYGVGTAAAYRVSAKRFERVDL